MSIESRSRQYGKVFDHWQIREFLGGGSGGKSAVFRLVHTESSTVFSALKIISLIERRGKLENLSDSRKAEYDHAKKRCKEHAEQEVLLMNGLQGQSNVVGYLDHTFIDWEDKTGYGYDMLIRMELLKDLRSRLEEEYHFSQEEVLKIGRDICNALVLCHHKEFYHRDIKPENIFYNKDGNYKLGDFGISKIMSATPGAKSSTRAYTEEYAAPEQIFGRYDNRVDIYSLGLVLYELSNNGLLPFASSPYIAEIETQERLIGKPISAPKNASKAFADVILKACAHNPDDRYQTAEEFLAELNYLAGVGPRPAAKAPSTGRTTQKANHSGNCNATQYAKSDSAPQHSGRETVCADPASIPYVERKELTPNKPKRLKAMIIAAVLLLVVSISVAVVFGLNSASNKDAISIYIDEADNLAASSDYADALGRIIAGLAEYPDSSELQEKKDTYSSALVDQEVAAIITETDALVSEGKHVEAIEKIKGALIIYPDNEMLLAKKVEYDTVHETATGPNHLITPVYINELTYQDKYGKVYYHDNKRVTYDNNQDWRDQDTPGHVQGLVRDGYGNTYTYGIHLDGNQLGPYYITYEIGGEYTMFSGWCVLPDFMVGSVDALSYSKYFEIYCDGKLTFVSDVMSDGSESQYFEIDVTDVDMLTIQYAATSGRNALALLCDGLLS